jgi:hypothetical protein
MNVGNVGNLGNVGNVTMRMPELDPVSDKEY